MTQVIILVGVVSGFTDTNQKYFFSFNAAERQKNVTLSDPISSRTVGN
jgi:hypothetical protein